MFDKAIRIGELLFEQKEKLKHGEFIPWTKINLPFSDRTARNYMKLFENQEQLKMESVSNLNSAYKLLGKPKEEQNKKLNLIKISKIIFKKDLWARFGINYDVVKKYSKYLDVLPPVELSEDFIMIDGWLRAEAFKWKNRIYIPYFITKVQEDGFIKSLDKITNERAILTLSAYRNSTAGISYSWDEENVIYSELIEAKENPEDIPIRFGFEG